MGVFGEAVVELFDFLMHEAQAFKKASPGLTGPPWFFSFQATFAPL